MSQSFTSLNGQVYLSGSALTDHRVEDLLTLFEAEATEAAKAARVAREAFNALWDARCQAMDFRQDRRTAA
jgi:hypothetical protein